MKLSHRAQTVEPFHALVFGQRAAALEAQGHHIVKLSIGEPDFGAPPAVRDAMREVMDGRPLPYTHALGLPALRTAIADFYRDRHDVDVDPARIIVTSGASTALLLVVAATDRPRRRGDPRRPLLPVQPGDGGELRGPRRGRARHRRDPVPAFRRRSSRAPGASTRGP